MDYNSKTVQELKNICKINKYKGYSGKNKTELIEFIKNKNINETGKKSKTSEKIFIQKPFLKWLGGKTNIIDKIIETFPKSLNNYHEIFLGGGSVLFAVLSLQKANQIEIKNKIYAYDINSSLINLYKNIQNNKNELFNYITHYLSIYDKLTGTIINRKPQTEEEYLSSKESYYYYLRNKFNTLDKNSVEYSALFLFLNKTCFRGVYREGPNGFNVPYGHYKTTPAIISKENLDNISDLIKNVEFICCDFETSIKNIKNGDFTYLDPPYAPETKTSFVGYTKDGFTLDKHKKLFDLINKCNEKNIKLAMSNAKVDLVLNSFDLKKYKMNDIIAKRAINSKNPESVITEVIIYN